MTTLTQTDIEAIASRHPAVFRRLSAQAATAALIGIGVVAYL